MTVLARSTAPHKLLVILGDGNDTEPEVARTAFAALRKRARVDGVTFGSVIYKGPLSDADSVVTRLDPLALTVNSMEGIASALHAVVDRATDEQTITFDTTALAHDGRPHDLTLQMGRDPIDAGAVTLPGAPAPASLPITWWEQLGLGVALVGVLAGLTRLRLRAL